MQQNPFKFLELFSLSGSRGMSMQLSVLETKCVNQTLGGFSGKPSELTERCLIFYQEKGVVTVVLLGFVSEGREENLAFVFCVRLLFSLAKLSTLCHPNGLQHARLPRVLHFLPGLLKFIH